MTEDKGFKAGLESLLQEAWKDDGFQEKNIFLPEIKTETKKVIKKGKSRKNFTNSFSSLFEEAFEETIDEKIQEIKQGKPVASKRRTKKLDTGIDQLIKSTIETSQVEVKEIRHHKRVTFLFDEKKLEKLKQIAKLEKLYLKDILNDIVSDFIKEYEQ